MTIVPIAYFQVLGAAIPTALIAAGITSRLAEVRAKELEESTSTQEKVSILFALVVFGLIALAGETAALMAVATNFGTAFQATISFSALLLLIVIVLAQMIYPLFAIVPNWARLVAGLTIIVMAGVAFLAFHNVIAGCNGNYRCVVNVVDTDL